MVTPIITDGTMERVVAAPRVVLPDLGTVFADRAARFLQLAAGHPMSDYLTLMGRVAQAQHALAGRRQAPPVSDTALAQSRDYGMPPASALSHVRDPQWQDDLAELLAELGRAGVDVAQLGARGAGRSRAGRQHARR